MLHTPGFAVVICPGFNLCLHFQPMSTFLGTYHQQKHVVFELGPLLRLREEIERGLTHPMGWKQQPQPCCQYWSSLVLGSLVPRPP